MYTIRQLVELGLINSLHARTDNKASNYIFISKEIHAGRLKAKNIGQGKQRGYWIISKKAVADWLKEYR